MDSHVEPVRKKKKSPKKKLKLLLPQRVEREVEGKQLQTMRRENTLLGY